MKGRRNSQAVWAQIQVTESTTKSYRKEISLNKKKMMKLTCKHSFWVEENSIENENFLSFARWNWVTVLKTKSYCYLFIYLFIIKRFFFFGPIIKRFWPRWTCAGTHNQAQ